MRPWFWIAVILSLLAGAAIAQETPAEAAPRCSVPYIAAEKHAAALVRMQGGLWHNLEEVDFAQRRAAIAGQMGPFSLIFAESVADLIATTLELNIMFDQEAEVMALVARLAGCDEVFGFRPAITAGSEMGLTMVRMQKKLATYTPLEILECHRAYSAGEATPEVQKIPVAQLWSYGIHASFGLRVTKLSQYADLNDVHANIPAIESSRPNEELWVGKLPVAIAMENSALLNEFWAQVAACDQMIEISPAVTPGPLLTPEIGHEDCSANYTVLRELYRNDQNTATYFHERGLNALRYLKFSGSPLSDEELFAASGANAMNRFASVVTPQGQPVYPEILLSFEMAQACDRQYGIQQTQIPQQIIAAAQLASE